MDPASGALGAWQGREAAFGRLALTADGQPAIGTEDSRGPPPRSHSFRAGGGAWERRIPLADGRVLLERGLVPEDPPALVLQWSFPAGDPAGAPVELVARLATAEARWALTAGAAATAIALPEHEDGGRAERLLHALAAREKLRARRHSEFPGLRVRADGDVVPELEVARIRISDALLRVPGGPALFAEWPGGFGGAAFLGGGKLTDLGRAALRIGLVPVAHATLEALSTDGPTEDSSTATDLLRLAADWVAWTGDLDALAAFRPALESAARARGMRLPADLATLGEALGERDAASGLGIRARLPPADTVLGRVDEWLGALPDARYGRLRLAPLVHAYPPGVGAHSTERGEGREDSWRNLEVEGIAFGDARVDLGIDRDARRLTFHLHQGAGKVPINLVFEPRVRGARVAEVRIGGARADVELAHESPRGEEPWTRVRCQFPLDPERRVELLLAGEALHP